MKIPYLCPHNPFIALWTQSPPGSVTNPHNDPELRFTFVSMIYLTDVNKH